MKITGKLLIFIYMIQSMLSLMPCDERKELLRFFSLKETSSQVIDLIYPMISKINESPGGGERDQAIKKSKQLLSYWEPSLRQYSCACCDCRIIFIKNFLTDCFVHSINTISVKEFLPILLHNMGQKTVDFATALYDPEVINELIYKYGLNVTFDQTIIDRIKEYGFIVDNVFYEGSKYPIQRQEKYPPQTPEIRIDYLKKMLTKNPQNIIVLVKTFLLCLKLWEKENRKKFPKPVIRLCILNRVLPGDHPSIKNLQNAVQHLGTDQPEVDWIVNKLPTWYKELRW